MTPITLASPPTLPLSMALPTDLPRSSVMPTTGPGIHRTAAKGRA